MSKLPPMYLNPPVMRAQLRAAHAHYMACGTAGYDVDRAKAIAILLNMIEDALGLVLPREINEWDHTRRQP